MTPEEAGTEGHTDRMDAAENRMAAGEGRAAASEQRADASVVRADASDVRAGVGEDRMRATEDAIAEETFTRAKALVEMRETVRDQSDTIGKILIAIGELTTAVSYRPTKRETWGIVGKAVVATFLLVAAIFVLNLLAWKQSDEDRRVLIECTTPSEPDDRHECYENGQEATASAIAQIVQASVYTAQCALDGAPDLGECVSDRLAADDGDP